MFAKLKKWFIEFILVTLAISGCTRSLPANVSSLEKGGEKTAKKVSLLPQGLFKKKVVVTPPGDYVLTLEVKDETIEGAQTRSYSLHVPPSYDGTIAVPLMILLHPAGMTTADFAGLTKFNALADQKGFITVYPDAYGDKRAWNPGFIPGSGANDTLFISNLIDFLLKNHKINPQYVFVAGYYDGGMLAYKLAANLPDKIAAVGAVGATIGYQKGANDIAKLESAIAPVSVVVIHGRLDEVVPYEGSKALKKGEAGFLPGFEALRYWIAQDQCDPKPDVKSRKNENILKVTYSCLNNTSVQLIAIQNGNHAWPGSVNWSSEKKAKMDIEATDALWEFLVTHPLPKPAE